MEAQVVALISTLAGAVVAQMTAVAYLMRRARNSNNGLDRLIERLEDRLARIEEILVQIRLELAEERGSRAR